MSKEQKQIEEKHNGKTLNEWRDYINKDMGNIRSLKYIFVLEELLTKEKEQREELITLIKHLIKSIEISGEMITGYQYEKIREANEVINPKYKL